MSAEGDGRWLVVVFGPAPQTNMVKAYSASDAPKVMWKVSPTIEGAVEQANVPAGGHALVVAGRDVVRFDRAERAPLERRPSVSDQLTTAAIKRMGS